MAEDPTCRRRRAQPLEMDLGSRSCPLVCHQLCDTGRPVKSELQINHKYILVEVQPMEYLGYIS